MTGTITADWLLTAELAPDTTDVLAPLYAAAAEGQLRLPRCGACGLALELEQRVCDGCDAITVVWQPVEPTGTVHSVTVVHRREPGLVLADGPYPVADVELASGHRLVLAPVGPGTPAPAIGDPVSIGFRRLGDVTVPGFAVPSRPELHRPSRLESPARPSPEAPS
jgi:uncharacterized OB-fold protein